MSAFDRAKAAIDRQVCDEILAENTISAKNKSPGSLTLDNLSVNSEPPTNEVSFGSTCNGIVQQDAKPRLRQRITEIRPEVQDIVWATFLFGADSDAAAARETVRWYFAGSNIRKRVRALDGVNAFAGRLTNALLTEFSSKRVIYFPQVDSLSTSPGLDTAILNYVNDGGIFISNYRLNTVVDTMSSLTSTLGVTGTLDSTSARDFNVTSTELSVSTFTSNNTFSYYFTEAHTTYPKSFFLQYQLVSPNPFNIPAANAVYGDITQGSTLVSNTRNISDTPVDLTTFDVAVGSKARSSIEISNLAPWGISAITEINSDNFSITDPAFNTITKVPIIFQSSRDSTVASANPVRNGAVSVQYGDGRLVLFNDYLSISPTETVVVDSTNGNYFRANNRSYTGAVLENFMAEMVSQLLNGSL